jgi:hypothetical protein
MIEGNRLTQEQVSRVIEEAHHSLDESVTRRKCWDILTAWVGDGFVVVVDPAKRTRKYGLSSEFAGDDTVAVGVLELWQTEVFQ